MELDDLESQGTFIDFSWHSYDEDGFLPLETAFALFTSGPRHALTGAVLWQPAMQPTYGHETREDNSD